jgi:hypothetical protein
MKQRASRIRSDGWTAGRQLAFLDALAATRSVTKAGAAAGMSREGAYRLRARDPHGLFAALWDQALEPAATRSCEGHAAQLGNGSLLRLLGTHIRRKRGDFFAVGLPRTDTRPT